MDGCLLTFIAGNDTDAVEKFVIKYGRLVWSLAKNYTGSQKDAEKETQNIFSDLWRQAGRFAASGLTEISFIHAVARCRQRRLASRTLVYSPSSAEAPTSLTARPNAAIF